MLRSLWRMRWIGLTYFVVIAALFAGALWMPR